MNLGMGVPQKLVPQKRVEDSYMFVLMGRGEGARSLASRADGFLEITISTITYILPCARHRLRF